MSFKNYLKLALANFDKTWKLVLYRVIVWVVLIALMAPCYMVVRDVALSVWNGDLFVSFAQAGLFYGQVVTTTFAKVIEVLLSFLTTLFASHLGVGIYLCVVLFFIRPIFMNVGRYVVDEMMYGFMSSHAKLGFASTFVRTLKKSLPYAFFRFLYCLPFNYAVLNAFYGLAMANWGSYSLAMPFAFLAVAAVVLSLKHMMILGWGPAMVVYNENVFTSFRLGIKAVNRNLKVAFIFSFFTYFSLTLFALGLGPFSLIVLVPLFAVVSSMFETMFFFACQGMRYYIDEKTVLSSKKLEEQDTMSKAKFLL